MNSHLQQAIVDALPQPALVLDANFSILSANKFANKLFETELAGKPLVRVLRQPEALTCLKTVVQTQKFQTCDIEIKVPTTRTYQASAAYVDNNILFTLTDISAEIDAEKARSTFVANVSHELRSPLTSLMGIVETLQGPARNDEKARDQFLDLMHGETDRMSRLVGDLLSLSKLEAKEHLPPSGEVDIGKTIKRVIAVLEGSAPENKGRVEVLAPNGEFNVRGDQDELTEVFQNLIENALKYSAPETPVHIEIHTPTGPQSVLHVKIRDQGEGIDPEHLPRLTERFYRVDKGRSREMGGTGLGLAITKHILNRHRGRLTIDSKLDKGSTFTVSLPV
jgi:two-component system phosphate regulon sensor histidine kinase PhoR